MPELRDPGYVLGSPRPVPRLERQKAGLRPRLGRSCSCGSAVVYGRRTAQRSARPAVSTAVAPCPSQWMSRRRRRSLSEIPLRDFAEARPLGLAWLAPRSQGGATPMSAVSVTGTDFDNAEKALTLSDVDASVDSSPGVPEEEIAVRYYSDEALLTSIRPRRDSRAAE